MSITNHIEEPKTKTLVNIFGRTDIGKSRDHNEDNFAIGQDIHADQWEFDQHALKLGELGSVMVVADGMGGTNAGEVASEIMVNTAKQMFQRVSKVPETSQGIKEFLVKIIKTAHKNILDHAAKDASTAGMGTTAVIAWIVGHKAYVAWAGDSRAYLYRTGVPLYPATDDHSMVWQLVQNGNLTPNEARLHPQSNIITQSLGEASNPPNPDTKTLKLQKGDRLMLCSDGLNGMLDDPDMEAILQQTQGTPQACQELVNQANLAGGNDNITVLLMDVLDMSGHNSNDNRDTADQSSQAFSLKKGLTWGISLVILALSIYLFANTIIGKKRDNAPADSLITTASLGMTIKKLEHIADSIKKAQNTKDSSEHEKQEENAPTQPDNRNNFREILDGNETTLNSVQVQELSRRVSRLLNEKATILKNIKKLKESYRAVPAEINKLNNLEQRLTSEVASPLIASKIIEGSNTFIKPVDEKAYEKALDTIERVEANLIDIQEKMRYWSLSPANG